MNLDSIKKFFKGDPESQISTFAAEIKNAEDRIKNLDDKLAADLIHSVLTAEEIDNTREEIKNLEEKIEKFTAKKQALEKAQSEKKTKAPEAKMDTKSVAEDINKKIAEEEAKLGRKISPEEKQEFARGMFLKAKEDFQNESIDKAGWMKKPLAKFDKWWSKDLEKTRAGKVTKVAISTSVIAAGTTLSVVLGKIDMSQINLASRMGMRVLMATGLNMALTSNVTKKLFGIVGKGGGEADPGLAQADESLRKKYVSLKGALMVAGIGASFMLSGPVIALIGGIGLVAKEALNTYVDKKIKEQEKNIKNLSQNIKPENFDAGLDIDKLVENLDSIGAERDEFAKKISRLKWGKSLLNGALTMGVGVATLAEFSHEYKVDAEEVKNLKGMSADELKKMGVSSDEMKELSKLHGSALHKELKNMHKIMENVSPKDVDTTSPGAASILKQIEEAKKDTSMAPADTTGFAEKTDKFAEELWKPKADTANYAPIDTSTHGGAPLDSSLLHKDLSAADSLARFREDSLIKAGFSHDSIAGLDSARADSLAKIAAALDTANVKVPADNLQKMLDMDADSLKGMLKMDSTQIQNFLKINPDTFAKYDSILIAKLAGLPAETLAKATSLDSTIVAKMHDLTQPEFNKAVEAACHIADLKSQIAENMKVNVGEHLDPTPNPDAIIHHGQGIEHGLIKRIMKDPELQKALHWDGKEDLRHFADREAHLLTMKEGYVNSADGKEVWVMNADKVAYDPRVEDGKVVIDEKYIGDDGKWHIKETHSLGDPFEGKDIEKYESIHGSSHGAGHGSGLEHKGDAGDIEKTAQKEYIPPTGDPSHLDPAKKLGEAAADTGVNGGKVDGIKLGYAKDGSYWGGRGGSGVGIYGPGLEDQMAGNGRPFTGYANESVPVDHTNDYGRSGYRGQYGNNPHEQFPGRHAVSHGAETHQENQVHDVPHNAPKDEDYAFNEGQVKLYKDSYNDLVNKVFSKGGFLSKKEIGVDSKAWIKLSNMDEEKFTKAMQNPYDSDLSNKEFKFGKILNKLSAKSEEVGEHISKEGRTVGEYYNVLLKSLVKHNVHPEDVVK